jgi:hypothetical protein
MSPSFLFEDSTLSRSEIERIFRDYTRYLPVEQRDALLLFTKPSFSSRVCVDILSTGTKSTNLVITLCHIFADIAARDTKTYRILLLAGTKADIKLLSDRLFTRVLPDNTKAFMMFEKPQTVYNTTADLALFRSPNNRFLIGKNLEIVITALPIVYEIGRSPRHNFMPDIFLVHEAGLRSEADLTVPLANFPAFSFFLVGNPYHMPQNIVLDALKGELGSAMTCFRSGYKTDKFD